MKKEVVEQINKLIEEVESCAIDDEFKGYKASPLLKKIDELILANADKEKDTLLFIFETYHFLMQTYVRMGRFVLSAKYGERALDIAIILDKEYQEKLDYLGSLLDHLFSYRNYYVDDDCLDLYEKVKAADVVALDQLDIVFNRMKTRRRRTLKHDPIEMSEAYLKVIDEVEEKIDQNRTCYGMGSCHEIWALKFEYLLEKGINWKSPQMLNSRVMFD